MSLTMALRKSFVLLSFASAVLFSGSLGDIQASRRRSVDDLIVRNLRGDEIRDVRDVRKLSQDIPECCRNTCLPSGKKASSGKKSGGKKSGGKKERRLKEEGHRLLSSISDDCLDCSRCPPDEGDNDDYEPPFCARHPGHPHCGGAPPDYSPGFPTPGVPCMIAVLVPVAVPCFPGYGYGCGHPGYGYGYPGYFGGKKGYGGKKGGHSPGGGKKGSKSGGWSPSHAPSPSHHPTSQPNNCCAGRLNCDRCDQRFLAEIEGERTLDESNLPSCCSFECTSYFGDDDCVHGGGHPGCSLGCPPALKCEGPGKPCYYVCDCDGDGKEDDDNSGGGSGEPCCKERVSACVPVYDENGKEIALECSSLCKTYCDPEPTEPSLAPTKHSPAPTGGGDDDIDDDDDDDDDDSSGFIRSNAPWGPGHGFGKKGGHHYGPFNGGGYGPFYGGGYPGFGVPCPGVTIAVAIPVGTGIPYHPYVPPYFPPRGKKGTCSKSGCGKKSSSPPSPNGGGKKGSSPPSPNSGGKKGSSSPSQKSGGKKGSSSPSQKSGGKKGSSSPSPNGGGKKSSSPSSPKSMPAPHSASTKPSQAPQHDSTKPTPVPHLSSTEPTPAPHKSSTEPTPAPHKSSTKPTPAPHKSSTKPTPAPHESSTNSTTALTPKSGGKRTGSPSPNRQKTSSHSTPPHQSPDGKRSGTPKGTISEEAVSRSSHVYPPGMEHN